jgi:hypothetical protein
MAVEPLFDSLGSIAVSSHARLGRGSALLSVSLGAQSLSHIFQCPEWVSPMRSPQGDRASGGFLEIIRESRFRPARTLRTADRTRNSSSIAGALDTQAQNSGTTEHAVRVGVSQESVRHQRTVLGRGKRHRRVFTRVKMDHVTTSSDGTKLAWRNLCRATEMGEPSWLHSANIGSFRSNARGWRGLRQAVRRETASRLLQRAG